MGFTEYCWAPTNAFHQPKNGDLPVLFAEPPRTQGDVNFVLFGFPVRIHPYFWVVAFLLGFGGASGGNMRHAMVVLLVWTVALFVSILVHELGHAIAMRRFGFSPRITLHGFGGLASYNTEGAYGVRMPDTMGQILISAAGPGAGFFLATLIVAVIFLTGHGIPFALGGTLGVRIVVGMASSPIVNNFIFYVLYISILWGLVNLLPIYPLDGGHISREIALRIAPRTGIRTSLVISMWTAGIVSFLGLLQWFQAKQDASPSMSIPFVAIMFGYLAYTNYATLRSYVDGRSW
jgi:stage IV sporulation protein FB